MRSRIAFISLTMFLACSALSALTQAQERRERTIDEIKTEAIHRAEVGQYPLIGLDPADVKAAFENIHTADKDEWAAGFMSVGDKYFNEAKSIEKSDPTKANADYIRAWRHLFLRTMADPCFSRQAALLRKGDRRLPRARQVLRSAARSRAHSI